MIRRRHNRRRVPSLNTTATGDISFMLLVFFLVMTSMDTDKGLLRKLPPQDNEKEETIADIDKRNVLQLTLTASGDILADGKPLNGGSLRKEVMTFVDKKADRRKHIISISVDPKADYSSYFNMQNEIVAAYNTLRNIYSMRTFGRPYNRCTPSEKEQATDAYPQRIAENYPESNAGNINEEKEGGTE